MSTIIDITDHTFFLSQDEEGKNTMWGQCCYAADDAERSFGYFNILDLYGDAVRETAELPVSMICSISSSMMSLDEWDISEDDKNEVVIECEQPIIAKNCPFCYAAFKYDDIIKYLNREALDDEVDWEDIEHFKVVAPNCWKKHFHVPKPMQLPPTKKAVSQIGRIVSWGSIVTE